LSDSPSSSIARKPSFTEDFRRFFLRGLATLLPTLITLLLLLKGWEILWDYLGRHIITVIRLVHAYLAGPTGAQRVKSLWEQDMSPWVIEALGVALAVVMVYIVGLFVGQVIGRTAWRLVEMGVMRVPLIRAIYPAVKQVTDFVLAERRRPIAASSVVAVRPHESGIWSIGLVTGPGLSSLTAATGHEMVTVFIPSSPTAFSGYVVMVPREHVVELPLTVEEAMRLLVTGGVSGPMQTRPGPHPDPPAGALHVV
jgi:uncharacterized membrane protein